VPETVSLASGVLAGISAEAARQPGIECCGLLGGTDDSGRRLITHIYPAANGLASATAYEIAPQELFRSMRQMRSDGVQLMGIYHSHPRGENYPSPTDIARAYYSDTIYFIASPAEDCPRPVRAFRIGGNAIAELQVEVVP
jgi:proteasome lid subunit RPN8/RPN11